MEKVSPGKLWITTYQWGMRYGGTQVKTQFMKDLNNRRLRDKCCGSASMLEIELLHVCSQDIATSQRGTAKRKQMVQKGEKEAPKDQDVLLSRDCRVIAEPRTVGGSGGTGSIHLVEVKYCKLLEDLEDIRPQNQLEASKQQHRDLFRNLTMTSAQITPNPNLLGMDKVIYIPHTLETLEEFGLDTHMGTKLALKLHAHSVQYAYRLASNLENTPLNSHHRDQARGTASNPPDPHRTLSLFYW
eukprot:1138880-Pelagomonas_calceolata.AAC.3